MGSAGVLHPLWHLSVDMVQAAPWNAEAIGQRAVGASEVSA
jgi:hypothetical protein